MVLRIVPSNDLSQISSSAGHGWRASSDDPFFDIRYGAVREPIIVAYLDSQSDVLTPRVYFNRGRGYREDDTRTAEPNSSFIMIADIGRFGTLKSIRVDPAPYPCEFSFSIETYSSRDAAEAGIQARRSTDMPEATVWDVGKLPQFHVPLPNIKLRRSKSDTAKFVATHYKLAKSLPVLVPDGDVWLSVVVPVYNAPERYLEELVRSFEDQGVPGTELILSDDASTSLETDAWYKNRTLGANVHVVRNPVNGGIASATNSGLDKARGTWVAFLDHDDMVAPHAFKMISKTLVENPHADFLYTDELVVDERLKPLGLMLKPAYDPVLLTGVNYINHFSIYRRDRLKALGYLRTGFDGSQDYDLLLRYLEGIPIENVRHLPYPAYWWRRSDKSYSQLFLEKATKAARTAIEERFQREGKVVTVTEALTKSLHKVEFDNSETRKWPKISVIIPSRNYYELISVILDGLYNKTDYPNFEVVIVDNGTTDARVLELYRNYKSKYANFSVEVKEEKFNFSRAVNNGIRLASGEHYLILNNDIEIIDGGWLKEMVSCLDFESTGIVGAKLLYPNGRIQHAGVIVGLGGLAGHWYLNKPSDFGGPMNRLHLRNSVTCVTGAAMLISGECAETIGAWDETNFAVAYNDVDYCLRAHLAGIRCVWTPFALMYHNESASRGSDAVGDSKIRFDREKENLRRLYNTDAFNDRATNPGYGKWHSNPQPVPPSDILKSR
jgi:GT2 family glycosyltransferase